MKAFKSVLQKPLWRTLIFVTFTLLFYYSRTRPPDHIHDIQIISDYAFLAMGKTGVTILNLADRKNPAEVTTFNTYGYANNLEVVDELIFVADGRDGLKILSLELLGTTGELTQTVRISTPGEAMDVAVKGNYAYVAASNAGLVIYKTNPKGGILTEINTQDVDGRAEHIEIAGDFAYVSNHKNLLLIFDISDPTNPIQGGSIDIEARINGFVVDENTNLVYVATEEKGLVILNTSNMQEITATEFDQVKEANDIVLRGTFAYVASGDKGFFVLDISDINHIPILGKNESPDNAEQIDVIDEFVYVADDQNGLRAFESPVKFDFQSLETATSQGNFANVKTKGDYAYVAAGEAGIRVVKISDIAAPISVSFDDKVEDDYATALDIQGEFLYVTYRNKGLKEFDLAESPNKPIPSDVEVGIPGEANDVVVQGQYAYVAGGSAGFHIVDFNNISDLQIYSEETPGTAQGVFVAGEYAYVADGDRGFQIISIDNPLDPQLVQSVNTPGEAVSVFVSEQTSSSGEKRTYAFVADGSSGLYIADITDLNNPVEVASLDTRSYVNDVILQEKTAFLAEREEGLLLVDVSTINDPQRKSSQDTPGQASGLYLRDDDLVFVADWDRGLRIIDVEDQTKPQEVGFFDIPKVIEVLIAQNPYGFMVDGKKGMWVLDLVDPSAPVPISFYATPGQAKNLTILGSNAYIADGTSGLQVVNISNPEKPIFAGAYKEIQNARAVAVQNDFAYVISEDQKLHILNLTNLKDIKAESVYATEGIPFDIGLSKSHVYIVEGDKGLEIVNVDNKQKPASVKKENLNLKDSRAILVLSDWNHIFIADGVYGLKTFDIENPTKPTPRFTYPLDGGVANSLTIDSRYVFVTVDQKGVLVFDVFDLNRIIEVGNYEPGQNQDVDSDQLPFVAHSIAVVAEASSNSKRYITYVPAGAAGLQMLRADGKAVISEHNMYESPGEASLMQVIRSIPDILVAILTGDLDSVQAKVWIRLGYFIFGTILFFALSGLWLILLAQFVLPVETVRDGYKAANRLLASLMGKHGPVISIKEGAIVGKPEELDRPGPGVARVDLSSAIVLEKRALPYSSSYQQLYNRFVQREQRRGREVPQARTEGPGVVFIEPFESIHGVADLRPQFRIRPKVRAYTRDGIEIENPVWVIFTLGQAPEVLEVTYEGDRKPENLRVVNFETSYEVPGGVKTPSAPKQRVTKVKHLSDELDPEDQEEIHRYVQKQMALRYFVNAKTLAAQIDLQNQTSDSVASYVSQLSRLADRWGIQNREEILQFSDCISALLLELNLANPMEIRWFVYHVSILADELRAPNMVDYYDYLYPELVARYQSELQKLIPTRGLSRFARQSMSELSKESVEADSLRIFTLNALALWNAVRPEIINNLTGLDSDPENRVEIELFQVALERFDRITQSLIKVDFPYTNSYSTIAGLRNCVANLQLITEPIYLRSEFKFPDSMNYFSIRRSVRKIIRQIETLNKSGAPEFIRYLDLIKIYDFVQNCRTYVQEIRKANGEDRRGTREISACMVKIKQQSLTLDPIKSRSFSRPIRKLIKWADALRDEDPSSLYSFTRQVEDLWKKIESADQLATRRYIQNIKNQTDLILRTIWKFDVQIKTSNQKSEIRQYQMVFDQIQAILKECPFPLRLSGADSQSDRQIRLGPFLFFRRRVLAAVYSKALDLDQEGVYMPWVDLPAHVAAQTYRDLIAREQFDYLNQPLAQGAGESNMQKLKGNLSRRMRNQGVLSFRFVDHINGDPINLGKIFYDQELLRYDPRELKGPKVLRARGIKVNFCGFPAFNAVSPKISETLLDTWRAPWERRAVEMRSQGELQAVRVINHARAQAQRDMAHTLAHILQSSRSEEALAMRVFQALEATASNAETRQFLPRDTMYLLRSFRQWFLPDGDDQQNLVDGLDSPDEPPLLGE